MRIHTPAIQLLNSRHRHYFGIGIASIFGALLVAAVFYPGLSGSFIFDDKANISDNRALYMMGLDHVSAWRAASSFPYGPGLRPLPMLSFGLDFFRTESFDPAAYKSTNLAIHLVTFVVLAGFLRQLLLMTGTPKRHASWLGLAISLLWAVHPLMVSSVLYVVQRMQTMASLFLLLALWAYLIMRKAQKDGHRCVRAGICMLAFWVLAMASKEDAALLPAYTLILELTALGFAAQTGNQTRCIKWGYAAMLALGAIGFVFWIVPALGRIDTFPGRDFNSYERVLTQGRVLLMYLGQIVWPSPDNMPFFYDNYVVSRGWLEPPSTLQAWLVLASLMALAVWARRRRPLLALGILWFFAGHAVTSNILGLELAFEHRNHFPLVGIILALVDVCVALLSSLRLQKWALLAAFALALCTLATGTFLRSQMWGNELVFAQKSTEIAPTSGRAWVELCRVHFELSLSDTANPHFGHAIDACQKGADQARSNIALANAIILKATRGNPVDEDWQKLATQLRTSPITPEIRQMAINMIENTHREIGLQPEKVIDVIEIIANRREFAANDNAIIARFISDKLNDPDRAFYYFRLSIKDHPQSSTQEVLKQLRLEHRFDWAERLESEG